tara:strand:- start:1560 stop:1673 length:114 start_codon:yes stop_codon:yes gene_type:complete
MPFYKKALLILVRAFLLFGNLKGNSAFEDIKKAGSNS